VETGKYDIMIGASSEDIRLKETVKVLGETIPSRDLTEMTKAKNYDDYSFGYIVLDEGEEWETCVVAQDNGAWISFSDVEFPRKVRKFEARVSKCGQDGLLQIVLDDLEGDIIGECKVTCEGDGTQWRTVSCDLDRAVTGRHDI